MSPANPAEHVLHLGHAEMPGLLEMDCSVFHRGDLETFYLIDWFDVGLSMVEQLTFLRAGLASCLSGKDAQSGSLIHQ